MNMIHLWMGITVAEFTILIIVLNLVYKKQERA
jgi:hypothetical protein